MSFDSLNERMRACSSLEPPLTLDMYSHLQGFYGDSFLPSSSRNTSPTVFGNQQTVSSPAFYMEGRSFQKNPYLTNDLGLLAQSYFSQTTNSFSPEDPFRNQPLSDYYQRESGSVVYMGGRSIETNPFLTSGLGSVAQLHFSQTANSLNTDTTFVNQTIGSSSFSQSYYPQAAAGNALYSEEESVEDNPLKSLSLLSDLYQEQAEAALNKQNSLESSQQAVKSSDTKSKRKGKAKKNGVCTSSWTASEDANLLKICDNYDNAKKTLTLFQFIESKKEQKLKHRSTRSCMKRYSALRSREGESKILLRWTKEEDEILIQNNESKDLTSLSDNLPGRSAQACYNRLSVLKRNDLSNSTVPISWDDASLRLLMEICNKSKRCGGTGVVDWKAALEYCRREIRSDLNEHQIRTKYYKENAKKTLS